MRKECEIAKDRVDELLVSSSNFNEKVWEKYLELSEKIKAEMSGMSIEQIRQMKKVLLNKISAYE